MSLIVACRLITSSFRRSRSSRNESDGPATCEIFTSLSRSSSSSFIFSLQTVWYFCRYSESLFLRSFRWSSLTPDPVVTKVFLAFDSFLSCSQILSSSALLNSRIFFSSLAALRLSLASLSFLLIASFSSFADFSIPPRFLWRSSSSWSRITMSPCILSSSILYSSRSSSVDSSLIFISSRFSCSLVTFVWVERRSSCNLLFSLSLVLTSSLSSSMTCFRLSESLWPPSIMA